MTSRRVRKFPNGDVEEIVTNPGAAPMRFFNGVLQIDDKKAWEWKKHYTWIPRRINGRWYWREYVYRYWCIGPGGGFWRYGDEFDLLKND